uniref:Uncharacterized protein n=1 Tax=Amphimedon queenslandica TaxID=400682 RepID=A0A1X7VSH9_AMPQE
IYVQYIDIPDQYTVLGEGFIGRDNKKLKQVVSLNIIKFESSTIYYQLKRYDLRRIYTVT